jgi:hypothetical protein
MLEKPLERIEALRSAGEVKEDGRDAGDAGDVVK